MEGQGFGYSSERPDRPLPHYALHRAESYPIYWGSSSKCPSELTVIALDNSDVTALNSMTSSNMGEVFHEARLVPTSINHICVMVGKTLIGDLPDSSVILKTQIARIYASGCVPTCLLSIDAKDVQAPAKIYLHTDSYAVPVNNPPASNWVLLSSGALWPAEPVVTSLFRSLPHRAQVLMEIRVVDDVALLYLDGIECAILAIDSLNWAYRVQNFFTKRGIVPVVRAYVTRNSSTDTVELCIDTLEISEWTREEADLAPNPLTTLIDFQADPLEYPPLELPAEGTPIGSVGPHKHRPLKHKKLLQLVTVVAGMWCMAFGLSMTDVDSHHAVGFGLLGILATLLGGWAWYQRRHPKDLRQHRFWSCLGPIALSTALPSLAFATIGLFLEAPTTSHHSELIPMQTFPTASSQLLTENSQDVTEDIHTPASAEPQALYQAAQPVLPAVGSVSPTTPVVGEDSETLPPADETAEKTYQRYRYQLRYSYEPEADENSTNEDSESSTFVPVPISPSFTPLLMVPTTDPPSTPSVSGTDLVAGIPHSCVAEVQEESTTASPQSEAEE